MNNQSSQASGTVPAFVSRDWVASDFSEGAYEKTLDEIIGALPVNHLALQQLAGIRANLAKCGKSDGTALNLDPWIQVAKLRAENARLFHELKESRELYEPKNVTANSVSSGDLFGVWDQYFCAALLAQMSSQTVHDEPHLWQPYQAQLSAGMADIMMAERAKRFPPNVETSQPTK